MKNFLVLLIIFVISYDIQAQTTIEGVGKIKLNMTLAEAKKAFPKMMIPLKGTSKFKKLYKINAYTPIKNHTLRDIRLHFYNDTLYAFYVKNAPAILKLSLETKYGKTRENIRRFDNQLLEHAIVYEDDGADYLLETVRKEKNNIRDFFYEWNEGNPFLQCIYLKSLYVNDKGKEVLDDMFYMKNRAIAKIIEIKEKLQEIEDKEKNIKELEGL